jgi:signal transduction histidine kinase
VATSLTVFVVKNREGQPGALAAIIKDVTERKTLEMQLFQAQKMEAIGQLTGGIAHDFNNLLTIVNGYSEMLLQTLPASDPQRDNAVQIKEAGERAVLLTRQLLAFSRRQMLEPKVLELNAVVTNTEKMLTRMIGEDIQLVTALMPRLGRVKADPGQIEQVIVNLAVNARDAMPQGGKLTIETANVELDENFARRHVVVKPGQYVMLAASDTGCGMDAETQKRIFEPFFTTKERGKGTGLGLATVYGIVKQSGGSIWVYSEVGRGTTFKMYLPRVEEEPDAVLPGTVRAAPLKGTETILLVEDDTPLRKLTLAILRHGGYDVLSAASREEALQLCGRHQGPIHLMLTDVVMPGRSVREFVEQLASTRPAMKVLHMSGYTDDTVVRHGVMEQSVAFLQKPFTTHSLLRKVREVLDA